LKVASRLNNFEYFYPVFSKEILDDQKNQIINFIFNRNKTICKNENYNSLKSPDNQIIFKNSKDLHLYLEQILTDKSFDLVLTYASPIIKSKRILEMLSFNLHLGLSRFYRGGTSNITALSMNELDKVGSTCHELNEKIDDGKVLFEIKNLDFDNFENIDEMNYYILKQSIRKLIKKIKIEDYSTFLIPKGSLILNKSLKASTIIKAEKNLLNNFITK
tara:strand:+ start:937 stop:1590 length:654 start_codon:yes stop_codon:yes gene_type:complete